MLMDYQDNRPKIGDVIESTIYGIGHVIGFTVVAGTTFVIIVFPEMATTFTAPINDFINGSIKILRTSKSFNNQQIEAMQKRYGIFTERSVRDAYNAVGYGSKVPRVPRIPGKEISVPIPELSTVSNVHPVVVEQITVEAKRGTYGSLYDRGIQKAEEIVTKALDAAINEKGLNSQNEIERLTQIHSQIATAFSKLSKQGWSTTADEFGELALSSTIRHKAIEVLSIISPEQALGALHLGDSELAAESIMDWVYAETKKSLSKSMPILGDGRYQHLFDDSRRSMTIMLKQKIEAGLVDTHRIYPRVETVRPGDKTLRRLNEVAMQVRMDKVTGFIEDYWSEYTLAERKSARNIIKDRRTLLFSELRLRKRVLTRAEEEIAAQEILQNPRLFIDRAASIRRNTSTYFREASYAYNVALYSAAQDDTLFQVARDKRLYYSGSDWSQHYFRKYELPISGIGVDRFVKQDTAETRALNRYIQHRYEQRVGGKTWQRISITGSESRVRTSKFFRDLAGNARSEIRTFLESPSLVVGRPDLGHLFSGELIPKIPLRTHQTTDANGNLIDIFSLDTRTLLERDTEAIRRQRMSRVFRRLMVDELSSFAKVHKQYRALKPQQVLELFSGQRVLMRHRDPMVSKYAPGLIRGKAGAKFNYSIVDRDIFMSQFAQYIRSSKRMQTKFAHLYHRTLLSDYEHELSLITDVNAGLLRQDKTFIGMLAEERAASPFKMELSYSQYDKEIELLSKYDDERFMEVMRNWQSPQSRFRHLFPSLYERMITTPKDIARPNLISAYTINVGDEEHPKWQLYYKLNRPHAELFGHSGRDEIDQGLFPMGKFEELVGQEKIGRPKYSRITRFTGMDQLMSIPDPFIADQFRISSEDERYLRRVRDVIAGSLSGITKKLEEQATTNATDLSKPLLEGQAKGLSNALHRIDTLLSTGEKSTTEEIENVFVRILRGVGELFRSDSYMDNWCCYGEQFPTYQSDVMEAADSIFEERIEDTLLEKIAQAADSNYKFTKNEIYELVIRANQEDALKTIIRTYLSIYNAGTKLPMWNVQYSQETLMDIAEQIYRGLETEPDRLFKVLEFIGNRPVSLAMRYRDEGVFDHYGIDIEKTAFETEEIRLRESERITGPSIPKIVSRTENEILDEAMKCIKENKTSNDSRVKAYIQSLRKSYEHVYGIALRPGPLLEGSIELQNLEQIRLTLLSMNIRIGSMFNVPTKVVGSQFGSQYLTVTDPLRRTVVSTGYIDDIPVLRDPKTGNILQEYSGQRAPISLAKAMELLQNRDHRELLKGLMQYLSKNADDTTSQSIIEVVNSLSSKEISEMIKEAREFLSDSGERIIGARDLGAFIGDYITHERQLPGSPGIVGFYRSIIQAARAISATDKRVIEPRAGSFIRSAIQLTLGSIDSRTLQEAVVDVFDEYPNKNKTTVHEYFRTPAGIQKLLRRLGLSRVTLSPEETNRILEMIQPGTDEALRDRVSEVIDLFKPFYEPGQVEGEGVIGSMETKIVQELRAMLKAGVEINFDILPEHAFDLIGKPSGTTVRPPEVTLEPIEDVQSSMVAEDATRTRSVLDDPYYMILSQRSKSSREHFNTGRIRKLYHSVVSEWDQLIRSYNNASFERRILNASKIIVAKQYFDSMPEVANTYVSNLAVRAWMANKTEENWFINLGPNVNPDKKLRTQVRREMRLLNQNLADKLREVEELVRITKAIKALSTLDNRQLAEMLSIGVGGQRRSIEEAIAELDRLPEALEELKRSYLGQSTRGGSVDAWYSLRDRIQAIQLSIESPVRTGAPDPRFQVNNYERIYGLDIEDYRAIRARVADETQDAMLEMSRINNVMVNSYLDIGLGNWSRSFESQVALTGLDIEGIKLTLHQRAQNRYQKGAALVEIFEPLIVSVSGTGASQNYLFPISASRVEAGLQSIMRRTTKEASELDVLGALEVTYAQIEKYIETRDETQGKTFVRQLGEAKKITMGSALGMYYEEADDALKATVSSINLEQQGIRRVDEIVPQWSTFKSRLKTHQRVAVLNVLISKALGIAETISDEVIGIDPRASLAEKALNRWMSSVATVDRLVKELKRHIVVGSNIGGYDLDGISIYIENLYSEGQQYATGNAEYGLNLPRLRALHNELRDIKFLETDKLLAIGGRTFNSQEAILMSLIKKERLRQEIEVILAELEGSLNITIDGTQTIEDRLRMVLHNPIADARFHRYLAEKTISRQGLTDLGLTQPQITALLEARELAGKEGVFDVKVFYRSMYGAESLGITNVNIGINNATVRVPASMLITDIGEGRYALLGSFTPITEGIEPTSSRYAILGSGTYSEMMQLANYSKQAEFINAETVGGAQSYLISERLRRLLEANDIDPFFQLRFIESASSLDFQDESLGQEIELLKTRLRSELYGTHKEDRINSLQERLSTRIDNATLRIQRIEDNMTRIQASRRSPEESIALLRVRANNLGNEIKRYQELIDRDSPILENLQRHIANDQEDKQKELIKKIQERLGTELSELSKAETDYQAVQSIPGTSRTSTSLEELKLKVHEARAKVEATKVELKDAEFERMEMVARKGRAMGIEANIERFTLEMEQAQEELGKIQQRLDSGIVDESDDAIRRLTAESEKLNKIIAKSQKLIASLEKAKAEISYADRPLSLPKREEIISALTGENITTREHHEIISGVITGRHIPGSMRVTTEMVAGLIEDENVAVEKLSRLFYETLDDSTRVKLLQDMASKNDQKLMNSLFVKYMRGFSSALHVGATEAGLISMRPGRERIRYTLTDIGKRIIQSISVENPKHAWRQLVKRFNVDIAYTGEIQRATEMVAEKSAAQLMVNNLQQHMNLIEIEEGREKAQQLIDRITSKFSVVGPESFQGMEDLTEEYLGFMREYMHNIGGLVSDVQFGDIGAFTSGEMSSEQRQQLLRRTKVSAALQELYSIRLGGAEDKLDVHIHARGEAAETMKRRVVRNISAAQEKGYQTLGDVVVALSQSKEDMYENLYRIFQGSTESYNKEQIMSTLSLVSDTLPENIGMYDEEFRQFLGDVKGLQDSPVTLSRSSMYNKTLPNLTEQDIAEIQKILVMLSGGGGGGGFENAFARQAKSIADAITSKGWRIGLGISAAYIGGRILFPNARDREYGTPYTVTQSNDRQTNDMLNYVVGNATLSDRPGHKMEVLIKGSVQGPLEKPDMFDDLHDILYREDYLAKGLSKNRTRQSEVPIMGHKLALSALVG